MQLIEKYRICKHLDDCLGQLKIHPDVAVAVSREYSHNISNIDIYCFEKANNIYDYALHFWVRKDFPHLKELNRFIGLASAGGLIEKWRSIKQTKTYAKHHENVYNNVNMKNLLGLVIILCSLEILAISTILIERIVHRNVHVRNPSKFWIFANMFINPDRIFLLETKWSP